MKIKSIFDNLRLREASLGYVLILVVIFIPIMLLATKYCLDLQTVQNEKVGRIVKKCAKEAALKVAQNWNPALSRDQQKESMLRLADEVYNASPAYNTTSLKYSAIPGLEMPTKIKVSKGGSYDPLKVEVAETLSLSPSSKIVAYKEEEVKNGRYMIGAAANDLSCRIASMFNAVYNFSNRDSRFVLESTFKNTALQYSGNGTHAPKGYPKFTMRSANLNELKKVSYNQSVDLQGSEISEKIQTRENPNDTMVQVTVDGDKIKVQTDDDIGYATPASCNVDIVLGIPVNGAASNINNLDLNSSTIGEPYKSAEENPTADGMKTPIYQIAHALKEKLVTPLKYTRGVNVGIVPYCGMCSLPLNRMESWSSEPENFISDKFLENQNVYQGYINGCFLYGVTYSDSTDNLDDHSSHWGIGTYSWTNVMARKGKMVTDTTYGGNILHYGDLLSTDNPDETETTVFSPKFMRRPIKKIFGLPGAADFLSMKFDFGTKSNWTWANPYSIVELQSDLLKIGDLLNLFYPFYFDSNQLSNFIFIPVTWANNLFQSWSKDPKYEAVDTNKANTNADQAGGRLSCPSKTTEGRKKALILVVNKPDWFEPGELTYLGYDNDFSEVPMIESDCIRFDTDYSDTTRKFADGTAYNGTIQGAKKILKFTGTNVTKNADSGFYECNGSGTVTLSFPKKYLLKVVVEPLQKLYWIYKGNSLGQDTGKSNWKQLAYNGSGWMAVNGESYTATSSNALSWSNKTRISEKNQSGIAYANGTYVTSSASNWGCYVSSDGGNTWTSKGLFGYDGTCDVAYGNGWWFVSNYWAARAFSQDNGATWNSKQDVGKYFGARKNFFITYSNGLWMALSSVGEIQTTSDLSQENWSSLGNKLGGKSSQWTRICGANRYFVALSSEGITAISRDNGQNWEYANIGIGSDWQGLCYGQNKFVACNSAGGIAFSDTRLEGTIEFSNIVTGSNYCTAKTNTITERKEFFIEADQINEGSDGNYQLSMKLDNIRLISAEITNRPYKKVTPTCTLSGTTSGSGTAYITSNVKKPITLDAKSIITNAEPSITFYNDNEMGSNVGKHIISAGGSKTFTFSSGAFSKNLSKYKVRYSTNNVKITNASLSGQTIRDCIGSYSGIYSNGEFGGNLHSLIGDVLYKYDEYMNMAVSLPTSAREACKLFRDSCMILGEDGAWLFLCSSSNCYFENHNGIYWQVYGLEGTVTLEMRWNNFGIMTTSCNIPASTKIKAEDMEGIYSGSQFYWVRIHNSTIKSLLNTTIDTTGSQNANVEQNKGIALQKLSSNLSTKIVAGDYICFQGEGELSVTAEPIIRSSYLKHYSPNGNEVSDLVDANTTKTVTITPEEYKYEKQTDSNGDVTYKITLNLDNLEISNAKTADTNKTVVYTKPRLPKMTRVVDFSQKASDDKFVYDIAGTEAPTGNNYFMYSSSPNGALPPKIQWSFENHWQFLSTFAGSNYLVPGVVPGDLYILSDDINCGVISGKTNYNMCVNPNKQTYIGSGIFKYYAIFNENTRLDSWGSDNNLLYPLELRDYQNNIPLIMGGVTLPINAMLYYGASGNTQHSYAFQANKNSTAWNGNDATKGCKNVTIEALKKLYSDWSSNIRIYVILYRKQTQYLHPTTKNATNFDYSYITNLAANTTASGISNATSSKPIFKCIDVADEANLNSTLNSIASEIKSWASYQAAKNVDAS